MSAFFAALLFIALMFWCGVGPVLLLLPRQDSARRVLLLPFAGLCAHILFSITLARFDLTGHTISILALVFFSVLTCWGLYRAPLSRTELRLGAVPLLIGAASMAFIARPLFQAGFEHYWGYANPDQIYLARVLEWVYNRPFSVPPDFAPQSDAVAYRGVAQNTILAIFYVIATLAAITRIPPDLLFNVAQAGLLFLTPISVFLLAEGLGLTRRQSVIASACIGCSALVTYTFCLDSLAALSVIAVVPVALALLLRFGKDGSIGYGVLFSVVSAAMYYNYLGAVGTLGVLVSALMLRLLVCREIPLSRWLVPPALTAGIIVLAYTPFAYSIFRYFLLESLSSRASHIAVTPAHAELLNFFALSFTEQGVPFFWGLQIPSIPAWRLFGRGLGLSPYLFAAGCLFFAVLALWAWPRISRLAPSYVWLLIAALLPLLGYAYKGMGYGVFKLMAWIHPIVVVGFVGALCGLADILRRSRFASLALVPYLAIAAYMGINTELSHRLGVYTQTEAAPGSPQNALGVTFQNVRQLRELTAPPYKDNVAVVVPDVVVQSWAIGYLETSPTRAFPRLDLLVKDSTPRTDRSARPETYLLHWRDDRDITPHRRAPAVWGNASLDLSRFDQLSNALIIGNGWYRAEQAPSSTAFWQKRLRWVRKRAEVLLWNPVARPQRLLLTLVAGYGNPRPDRHVSFYLNGTKFDEIHFSAYARVITKPFQATPPWSQIELEIEEDANPLPRVRALWATHIPREPRRLNVAVSELSLLEENSGAATALPSYVDLAAEFQSPRGLLEGIYPDRWVSTEASLYLQAPAGARQVRVSGMLPQAPGLTLPFSIDVELDDHVIGQAIISQFGAFRTAIQIPDEIGLRPGQTVRLKLRPSATFSGNNSDSRRLSFQLDGVGLLK